MSARLFYEDDRDAIRTMIGSSGKTFKECAQHLFPNLKPETAYAKLKTMVDGAGDEELKFSQVVTLMRFCQHYDPLYYVCDETLHARPDRKTPDDQRVALTEAIKQASEMMNRAMAQIAHLDSIR